MRKLRITILVAAALVMLGAPPLWAQGSEVASSKALFRRGARLWPMYCSQCHKARAGSELSPGQWDTVMMHMRARANLTGEDARAIMQFLKSR